jgi:hypothetical protein
MNIIKRFQYEKGIQVEKKKHMRTWGWLEEYVSRKGKLPKSDELFVRLAADNLQLDPTYYDPKPETATAPAPTSPSPGRSKPK